MVPSSWGLRDHPPPGSSFEDSGGHQLRTREDVTFGRRPFTLLGRAANPREVAGAASALRAGSYVIPHFPIMGMPEHGYLGYLPVVIA